jgi:DNA-binding MarR family transcriptional regulator
MAAESPTDGRRRTSESPKDGELVDFADNRLFGESTDTLERFTARKQALAHPVRYAILYHLFTGSDGEESGRIPRKELKRLLDREKNGLQTHMRPLLKANLLAEVPAPDGADGRQTFYRLTNLGKREIQSDLRNVDGERPE